MLELGEITGTSIKPGEQGGLTWATILLHNTGQMTTPTRPPRRTLFLFDLDGTLLLSGGAGIQALNQAFLDRLGVSNAMEKIVCDGKTDPLIVSEVLEQLGMGSGANSEILASEILNRYLKVLPDFVKQSQEYRVLPGVEDCISYLHYRPDVVLGLATGNMEPGARIKLERAKIGHYFRLGGYASDSPHRTELVNTAIGRAKPYGILQPNQVVVVGDTPRDIQAAHGGGAFALAVATGNYSKETLRKARADWVLDTLENPSGWVVEVLAAMSSGHSRNKTSQ